MHNKQIIEDKTHQNLTVSYTIYSIIKKNTSSQDTIGQNTTFQTEVLNNELANGIKLLKLINLKMNY